MDQEQSKVLPPDQQTESPKKERRNRFHLEKLEERIAPAAHYNPHTKLVGNGGGYDSSIGGSY